MQAMPIDLILNYPHKKVRNCEKNLNSEVTFDTATQLKVCHCVLRLQISTVAYKGTEN